MSFSYGPGGRPGTWGERLAISPYYMEKSEGQNGTVFPIVKKFLWDTADAKGLAPPVPKKSLHIFQCWEGVFG